MRAGFAIPVRLDIALVAVFLATTSLAQSRDSGSTTGTGSIAGAVIDGTSGAPVAGAVVSVAFANERPARPGVLTDSAGRFRVERLPAGRATMSASKNNYETGEFGRLRPGGSSAPLTLAEGERLTDAVIRIWRRGCIRGRVVDADDRPLAGVEVRAVRTLRLSTPGFGSDAGAYTNDLGEYELCMLPGSFVVAAPVFVGNDMTRPGLAPGETLTEFNGPPPHSVGGAIRDGAWWMRVYEGIGDLRRLPDGHVMRTVTTLHPSATTLAGARVITVEAGAVQSTVDIEMQHVVGYRVSGSVAAPTEASAYITAELTRLPPESADALPRAVSRVASNGAFAFLSVPPGRYELRLTRKFGSADVMWADDKGLFAIAPITVIDRDITDLALALQSGARLSGRVEFEEAPGVPSQISVYLLSVDGSGSSTTGRPSAENGNFVIESIQPGRYVVAAGGRSPQGPEFQLSSAWLNGHDVSGEPFNVGTDDLRDLQVRLTQSMTRISGTVVDASGHVTGDADAVVFPVSRAMWEAPERARRRPVAVRPRGDGAYVFVGLPAGEYFIAAIDERAMDPWPDPAFLASIAPSATRIQLVAGQNVTMSLRVVKQ